MNLSSTFTVFQRLDLLIVSWMNTSNIWNNVMEKLTIRLKSVIDVPVLHFFINSNYIRNHLTYGDLLRSRFIPAQNIFT